MYESTLLLGTGSNNFHFNTKDTGAAPITLAGTPAVKASVNGGVGVASGLTLTVDDDSITGFHQVALDVDDATLALADGDIVEIYLSAGTVDGVSVVGTVIARLAISDGSLQTQTKTDISSALLDATLSSYTTAGTAGERMGRIPNAAAGGNGGLPTVDASNMIAGIQGTKNALDDLNDLAAAEVNAQVDSALNTAVPGSPVAGSINERIKTMDDADIPGAITALNDFDPATDTVVLDATQGSYAPSKAGDQMDMVDAPNATAVTAIQSGLATAANVSAIRAVPAKNSAFTFTFTMVTSADPSTRATGLTVTAQVSKDAAAFGAAAGTVTEIGNGVYEFAAAAGDMNCNFGCFKFTAATAVQSEIHFITDGGV